MIKYFACINAWGNIILKKIKSYFKMFTDQIFCVSEFECLPCRLVFIETSLDKVLDNTLNVVYITHNNYSKFLTGFNLSTPWSRKCLLRKSSFNSNDDHRSFATSTYFCSQKHLKILLIVHLHAVFIICILLCLSPYFG